MDWWLTYLGLGAFVGFVCGLLGVGGGAMIVPILTIMFAGKGLSPEHVVHVALGTAMATILFTSASSVISHARRHAVNWRVLRDLVPGVVVGTFGGALVSGFLDSLALGIFAAIVVCLSATQLIFDIKPRVGRNLPSISRMWLAGGIIGAISSLAALGGGSLTMPFLVSRNVRVHEAIGTSAAVGWPLAFAGTAGYVVSGINVRDLPLHTIGFVYLPAVLWIVIASVSTAPIGATLAHRTPSKVLKRIFGVLLYMLAAKMLWKLLYF